MGDDEKGVEANIAKCNGGQEALAEARQPVEGRRDRDRKVKVALPSSTCAQVQTKALRSLRRELEREPEWPIELSMNAALLLYDVCQALGVGEAAAAKILGRGYAWVSRLTQEGTGRMAGNERLPYE